MTTSYTPLLGLALPVTGELAGTWGDVVSDYITRFLDSAVAGAQTISGSQTAVTLSVTNGTSLSQAGSGGTGSAQYAIINCTGNPASLLTVTAPAASKVYLLINATSTSQSVKLVGAGPTTGVTVISGEKALIAWNGSDFVKVASTAAAGGSNTQVQYNSSGVLAGSANLTFDGTSLTLGGNPTLSAGTANGVGYLNASKVLTTGSALTFDGTNFVVNNGYLRANNTIGYYTTLTATGLTNFATSMDFDSVSDYIFKRNGSEQMRLTSTGLGIGTSSPGYKLDVQSSAISGVVTNFQATAANTYATIQLTGNNRGGELDFYNGATAQAAIVGATSSLYFYTNGNSSLKATLDSAGNLGLGVTPSAWSSGKVLEIGNAGNAIWGNSTANFYLTENAYYNGGWKYASSNGAATYQMLTNSHIWSIAPSGTAGDAISFTQAMTLFASGNLSVGNTSDNTRLHVTGLNQTNGTAQFTANAAKGSNDSYVHYGTNGDWYIRSASASGNVNIQDTGGNVGIGTSSPAGIFNIKTSNGQFLVQNGTSSNQMRISAFNNAGNANAALIFEGYSSEYGRFDTSGNLGLGVTPSAWLTSSSYSAFQMRGVSLFGNSSSAGGILMGNSYIDSGGTARYTATAAATWYNFQGGAHAWYTAPSGTAGNAISFTQAMTLDASGNLGVGATSSLKKLTVQGSTTDRTVEVIDNGSNDAAIMLQLSGVQEFTLGVDRTDNSFRIADSGALGTNDRLVIDSSGNLLVGNTGGNGNLTVYGSSGDIQKIYSTQASSAIYSLISMFSDATTPSLPTGTLRVNILTNGGIANYQANDSNLSDRREKTNFAPAKSYLDTICAIPVQTFNYIDQSEDDPGLTLGVVAQDVQAVAPELVSESNWGTEDNPKMRLSIYQTDLQYALMKCIQEQQALIQQLTARVAQLEGK